MRKVQPKKKNQKEGKHFFLFWENIKTPDKEKIKLVTVNLYSAPKYALTFGKQYKTPNKVKRDITIVTINLYSAPKYAISPSVVMRLLLLQPLACTPFPGMGTTEG